MVNFILFFSPKFISEKYQEREGGYWINKGDICTKGELLFMGIFIYFMYIYYVKCKLWGYAYKNITVLRDF